jgi:hypothetical protein
MKIKPTPARKASGARHSDEYTAYLNSPAWAELRTAAVRRAGNRCEQVVETASGRRRCAETLGLEVHHRHYRTLGGEAWGDVVVLCAAHHAAADRTRAQLVALSRRLRAVRDGSRT